MIDLKGIKERAEKCGFRAALSGDTPVDALMRFYSSDCEALLDHIDKLTKCLLAAEHTLTTTHNLYATDRPDLINTPLASLIFWTTDNSEVLEWISTVLKEATTNETTT